MKHYKYILQIFMVLMSLQIYGQITPKQKDSLLQKYASSKNVQTLIILDKLVTYYNRNQPDSAVYYNKLLLQKAGKQHNVKYKAAYYANQAIYQSYRSKYYEAIDNINKAIAIQKKEALTNDLADSYKYLAGFNYYLENYDQAIEYMYRALHIYESEKNYAGIVFSLNNIGLLNEEAKYFDKALVCYHKGLRLIDEKDLTINKALFYANMGVVYKNTGKYDSALDYYKKSILLDKNKNSKRGLAHTLYDIGNLYAFYLKNTDSARYYYQRSVNFANDYDEGLLSLIYSSKAKMLIENNEVKQGISLMQKALKIAQKQQGLKTQELAHYKLYEAYKTLGKSPVAYKHLEDFVEIRDSINKQKTAVTLANLEAKYQNEKKNARIHELELKKTVDNKIKSYLIGSIILLLISFLLIIRNFYIKRKQNLLEKNLLKVEKDNINQDLSYKSKQLASQALMMMQKNKLIESILQNLSEIKPQNPELVKLKRKLKKSMHSEDDWELFKHYFEEINKDFFEKLKQINDKITPSERKLAALIKLRFNIKESAFLLNISPDSVKTARYILRKKLGLEKGENIYDFLNDLN